MSDENESLVGKVEHVAEEIGHVVMEGVRAVERAVGLDTEPAVEAAAVPVAESAPVVFQVVTVEPECVAPLVALPAYYLAAESAAPENLDRPDHDVLAALLAVPVAEVVRQAVAAPIGDPKRSVFERAARILDTTIYLGIEGGNREMAEAVAGGPYPILARFAAVQLAGVGNYFFGENPTQVVYKDDAVA